MKKIALFVSMFLLLITCGQQGEDTQQTEKSNQKAPDFTLKTLENEDFHLYDYLGNVIIINFWDTWCPPCRVEIPHFIELYSKYADEGFLMVGIAFGREGKDKVMSFAQEQGINYPLVIADQKVVSSYGGINAIPTTFIIDREGKIVEKVIGYRDKEFFEGKIKSLLSK